MNTSENTHKGVDNLANIVKPLKGDVIFQLRQGFYIVYILITLFYMLILSQLPEAWLKITVPIIVFTDPSVIGFIFIGGIILLEKEQGVIDYLTVTPLKIRDYICSKVLSLMILAECAGILITVSSYGLNVNFIYLIVGIGLSADIFTLLGLAASVKCKSVNGFILAMVPYFLIALIPFISYFDFTANYLLRIIPSYACFNIVLGSFNEMMLSDFLISAGYSFLWLLLLYKYVYVRFEKYVVYKEG